VCAKIQYRSNKIISVLEIGLLFLVIDTGAKMSNQVTLTLPDDLYENAQQWAVMVQRELPETLTDALRIVLTPMVTKPQTERPVSSLSDGEVITLSKVQMDKDQDDLLGKLLEKQREDALTTTEQVSLMALMQIYHQLWIRQSEALAEAVKRGLRPPLE
jgi:hypothetical protein